MKKTLKILLKIAINSKVKEMKMYYTTVNI